MKNSLIQILVAGVLSFLFFACSSNQDKKELQRPNIIFIIGDDVGCYDLGCYGNEKIVTPNIDIAIGGNGRCLPG